MAFDLGVDSPSQGRLRREQIVEVDESFSVVLIMEYMPESIVLLKRTFRWGLEDFIAISQNSHLALLFLELSWDNF